MRALFRAPWSGRRSATEPLAALADRVERLAGGAAGRGDAARRLAAAVARLEDRMGAIDRRLTHRHIVSGLPTREPLLARMGADGRGIVGTIGFQDFDRLAAFDPQQAERALLVLAERIGRMLGPERMFAHVDRAHFAIWYDDTHPPGAVRAELAAIGYALADAIGEGEGAIVPEIRVAHARLPEDGANPSAVVARALAALALGGGAASPVVPVGDAADAARERFAMEQDLRQAAARGEFRLMFQPLVDAGRGRVCGAESLLRWHHPVRGDVPPARFVPVFEAMGLADEVGLWALNAACREARCWQASGLRDLRVAVNVSGHQLDRDDIGVLVGRTLARHQLTPACLEIELTESVATSDPARTAELFDVLRAQGVRIAIDDFGTGFSSFSALRTLRFDKIKIDREFVTAVDTRPDSQAICQSIIALGRGLGIGVLAEGVERAAEYTWLRRHGCTLFQGYYFAQPLSPEAFAAFVRDRGALRALLDMGPRSARHRITERLKA